MNLEVLLAAPDDDDARKMSTIQITTGAYRLNRPRPPFMDSMSFNSDFTS